MRGAKHDGSGNYLLLYNGITIPSSNTTQVQGLASHMDSDTKGIRLIASDYLRAVLPNTVESMIHFLY